MTAIRVARRERYTSISRSTINDEGLSFRARGILIWLLDKPDDWRVDSEQIAAAAKEGRDAVRTALNELVAAGYIVRIKEQDEKGRWTSSTWVHERPVTDAWKPDAGPADAGQPGAIPKTVNEDCDKEEPSVPPPPRKRGDLDEQYDNHFAPHWTKRTGLGEGRKIWRDSKKMTAADRLAAIEGIKRHAAWWAEHGTERQFIPAMSVWLNGRRWEEDEPRTATPLHAVPSWIEQSKARRAALGGTQT